MNNESIFDQSSESAVLSCFLHAQLDEQREMLSTLREDHFHLYEHKLIFQSFLRVVGKSIHADYISIKSDLDGSGHIDDIGGDKTLSEIASYCQSSQNWRRYFPQLEEARYRRSLEMLAGDMAHKARDRDLKLEELKNWSETSVMKADYLIDDSEKLSIKSVVERALDNIESTMRGEPKIGVRTGLVPVDDLLMFGMRGGDMIVLAARPAVGKTSAAMQIAENVALDAQKRVLIFSLEMTSVSLMERMIRSRARVRAADILAQSITKFQRESLANAYAEVRDSHILCDDTSGKSIGYIKAVARRAHQKDPLDLIIIDYLQLLRGDSKRSKDNRVNEVEEISGGIKELAKTLRVPVLVLAQLNRDPEKRGGRPTLSDLKGSGCISGNSQILYRNRISKIEDLTNDADSGSVASMTSSNNIQYTKAKKAWLTKKSEQAYSLTLSTGHSIVATSNHKFLSKNGWFPLESFGVGDMLAIPLNMASESMDTVSPAEARILAAFIANGCCLERRSLQITFNSNDSDIAESLIKDIKEVFGNSIVPRISVEGHKSRIGNSWIQLYLPAKERSARGRENPAITFLKKHGLYNKRAKEKCIPQEMFFQKKETIYAFLAMLFACDGSCCICCTTPKKRRFVVASYASASKQLIDEVQLMLQAIGIVSGVSKVKCRGFISYTLQVYSRSFKNRFASLVGFSGKRKQSTMQEVVEKMNAAPLGYEKYIQEGDVVFVPIKSIEDAGKTDVYDMEVPKNHNFIANGILAHNSIEQDSDMVVILHCDEEDAKNHSQTPTVEFIVAKNREGATGIAPMSFNKAITRFEISSSNGRES